MSDKKVSDKKMYSNPVPLNREQHKNLRFKRITDYSFSSGSNSLPIAGIEFFEASRSMAVLFRKGSDGNFFPLVILSLNNQGHDMVDEEGKWKKNIYIPSFIRRYPFAQTGEGSVSFDADCDAFSEEEGERLFTEEGKNTQALDDIIAFLEQYGAAMRHTDKFCKALKERDLLIPFDVQVGVDTPNPVRVGGLYAVDDNKFGKLYGKVLDEWFKEGWVAWVFAHMHSIGALRSLPRAEVNAAAGSDQSASPTGAEGEESNESEAAGGSDTATPTEAANSNQS